MAHTSIRLRKRGDGASGSQRYPSRGDGTRGWRRQKLSRGVVRESRPDLVIRRSTRWRRETSTVCASTIQLTDTGIHPGSGVGNHRRGMTRENLRRAGNRDRRSDGCGAAAIVHGTVNALVRTLTAPQRAAGPVNTSGNWIRTASMS